jgi:HEAT repeat protein
MTFQEEVGDMMEHKHWYVREAAGRALAHIGTSCPQPVDVAAQKIENKDHHVRQVAVDCLQLMGERAELPPDLTCVAERLQHPEVGVRISALEALSSMGSHAAPHATEICSLVADDSVAVRRICVQSISKLGETVQEGADAAASHLGHPDNIIRRNAAEAMVLLQPPGKAADAVAKILIHENPKAREIAARTLGRIGAPAARHMDTMAELLEDPDIPVRNAAIDSMSGFGDAADPYVEHVIERLRNENAPVRRDAIRVLRPLGCASPKIAQDIFNCIDHPESMEMIPLFLRKAVIQTFGGLGANAQPFLMNMLDRLTDSDWGCKRAMVITIGELGPFVTEPALEEITRYLWHADPSVRRAAVEALGEMGEHATAVADSVDKCTDDDDEDVQEAARRAMTNWPQEEDEDD